MDFDSITQFLEEFDPAALLPELETVLGKLELVLRVAVLAAPLILLALGLCYFLIPPREANHSFGYRFYWGMSSVDSWLFTQKVAGIAWTLLGLVLTVVMAMSTAKFRGMEAMDMVWQAVRLILWEMGLVAVSCLIIDLIVIVCYNSKGIRRDFGKNKDTRPAK